MAGGQSRGLIIASRMKGWDSTVIVDTATGSRESIANFDKDQGNLPGSPVGRLPVERPDQREIRWDDPVTFRTPDTTRETPARR
jgi:hypothetical protein